MTKMDISLWNTYHSVTKVSSVTSRASLMITFLVVMVDDRIVISLEELGLLLASLHTVLQISYLGHH
jgi:hypothetical protein